MNQTLIRSVNTTVVAALRGLPVTWLVDPTILEPPIDPDPQLPPAVDRFMERALAKNPQDRFADAGQMRRALRELGAAAGIRKGENGFTYGILYQRELHAAAAARDAVLSGKK